MKCFVYFYNVLNEEPTNTLSLPPDSYSIRVYMGRFPKFIRATFFYVEMKSGINDFFDQLIPYNTSKDERYIYWVNLIDKLMQNNINELNILCCPQIVSRSVVEEIETVSSCFKLSVITESLK